jgi:hypothetical protein
MFTESQVSKLAQKKIFFGHQSVGNDVVQGIRDLMVQEPRLKLNIVTSTDPQLVQGPALIESPIGANRDAQSKDAAFTAIVEKGFGDQGGIAFYKYCYVDVDSATDVPRMFERYRRVTAAIGTKYPRIRIVHTTIPLTTVDPGLKSWIKTALGRNVPLNLNTRREQFNDLLRQTYLGKEPVFDLAEVESTHLDGSRSYSRRKGKKVCTLASDLTSDGGHLNEPGRRAAAERLLLVLSEL